ncbi:MAG: HAD family hydrolase [Nanoarchaeota archaeon]|nr:HAD family hydrolase [Nanoarchaeota archaeon]
MMIKTYLFDLDDTLIDSCVYKNSYDSIISKVKEIKNWDAEGLDKFAQENNIKKSEWGYDTGELCNILDLLDVYYELLEDEIRTHKKLKFDVNKKFKELKQKKIKIGICSNSMKRTIKIQLGAHDIKGHDFIFSSKDAGVKKDKKEYWQALIKKYNLIPNECLVIGDDEIDDKQIPSSLGFLIK